MLRASQSRLLICAAVLVVASVGSTASAQERWSRGQNIQPVFEGWERNADGSFNMVFGYLNRNYEEQPVVPVGPNNSFEPGPADRGQPTHFYNRRQQFVFSVRVPADWGDKDLVWTVTHNGRTDKAFGHLLPVWEMDAGVMRLNRGSGTAQGFTDNQRPFVSVDGVGAEGLEVTLPDSLEITVIAGDDGIPPPNPRLAERTPRSGPKSQAMVDARNAAMGLAVTWLHWRGPGTVTFDPRVPEIGEGGRAVTRVSFSEPGTYVLQAVADDSVLLSSTEVTVTVRAAASAP